MYTYRFDLTDDGTPRPIYTAAQLAGQRGLNDIQRVLKERLPAMQVVEPKDWHVTAHYFGRPLKIVTWLESFELYLQQDEGLLEGLERRLARALRYLDEHRLMAQWSSEPWLPAIGVDQLDNGAIAVLLDPCTPMRELLEAITVVHWLVLTDMGADPLMARRMLQANSDWRFNTANSKTFHVTLGYLDESPPPDALLSLPEACVRLKKPEWRGMTRL